MHTHSKRTVWTTVWQLYNIWVHIHRFNIRISVSRTDHFYKHECLYRMRRPKWTSLIRLISLTLRHTVEHLQTEVQIHTVPRVSRAEFYFKTWPFTNTKTSHRHFLTDETLISIILVYLTKLRPQPAFIWTFINGLVAPFSSGAQHVYILTTVTSSLQQQRDLFLKVGWDFLKYFDRGVELSLFQCAVLPVMTLHTHALRHTYGELSDLRLNVRRHSCPW